MLAMAVQPTTLEQSLSSDLDAPMNSLNSYMLSQVCILGAGKTVSGALCVQYNWLKPFLVLNPKLAGEVFWNSSSLMTVPDAVWLETTLRPDYLVQPWLLFLLLFLNSAIKFYLSLPKSLISLNWCLSWSIKELLCWSSPKKSNLDEKISNYRPFHLSFVTKVTERIVKFRLTDY
jgi:hypothetical protein